MLYFIVPCGLALVLPSVPVEPIATVQLARAANLPASSLRLASEADGALFPSASVLAKAEAASAEDVKKAVGSFLETTKSVVDANAPIIQKKIETEVLPTLDKAVKQAQIEEGAFLEKTGPAFQ